MIISCSHTPGENRVRKRVILRHNSTSNIKRLWKRFSNGVQIGFKFPSKSNRVESAKNVLLNLSHTMGQKDNPPFYRREVLPV